MNSPSYGDAVPIAAAATAPGESALAVIRTSGEKAVDLVAEIFSRPRKLREAPGSAIVHGWIVDPYGERPGAKIDEVLISVYRAPRSYTGEEGVDISCHGGSASVKAIRALLRKAGFRDSLPGEFTFRAFMNGKLDLTRAESVMELVSARTGRSLERAAARLSGALEREIREIRDLLVEILAGAEIYLDYSEDEFDDSFPAGAAEEAAGKLPRRGLAGEVLERLRTLAVSWRRERLYHEGALVVIAGRPNAGKSSLFNALLREDRSIVTDIPGTTRDWIESWIALQGIPIRLADTAGLHASRDAVEKIGMERSRKLLAEADLILYVIDGKTGITGEDRAFLSELYPLAGGREKPGAPVFPLWNKADEVPPPTAENDPAAAETLSLKIALSPAEVLPLAQALSPGGVLKTPLALSARTGQGVPELCQGISSVLEFTGGSLPESSNPPLGIGTIRQKELIDAALKAVEEALSLADAGEALDLIAPLLREGVNALGEITGEVSTGDILETMFSKFCVGK